MQFKRVCIIIVNQRLFIYQDWSQYGIDWEGPLPQGDSNDEVVVPDIANPLSNRDFDDLLEHVNPLAHDEVYERTLSDTNVQAHM